jgi:hypothetical protein
MAVWDWSAVKKLFDLLKQQKTYIFVSAHIDDEGLQNKHQCTRKFFSAKLN